MDAGSDTGQLWMKQWRSASLALAEQRKRELRALSAEQALAASDALLSLAPLFALSPDRVAASGLVRQQALLHRRAT